MPVAGGLYDQHPDLIDQWQIIMQARSQYEKVKNAKQAQKSKSGK